MLNNSFNGGGHGFGRPIMGSGGFNTGMNIMGNGTIMRSDGTNMGMHVNRSGSIMGMDGTSTGMRLNRSGMIDGPGGYNTGCSVPAMNIPPIHKRHDPVFPKIEPLYREPYNPYKPKDYSIKPDYPSISNRLDHYNPLAKNNRYDDDSYDNSIYKPLSIKKKYDPFPY